MKKLTTSLMYVVL